MSDLTILKVKDVVKTKPKMQLHPHLQQPPFFMSIIAPPMSGKSVLLSNMVYNKNYYRGYWDRIYLISPTANHDKSLRPFTLDENCIIIDEGLSGLDTIIDDILNDIVDSEDEKPDTLIILDDCLGFLSHGLERLASKYRHYRVSVIISCQNFRSIPLICRNCASSFIIFKMHNVKEVKKMVEEFGTSYKNFESHYNKITEKKHSFMVCDKRNLKMYDNFKTEVKDE